jgi:hypothetical protein
MCRLAFGWLQGVINEFNKLVCTLAAATGGWWLPLICVRAAGAVGVEAGFFCRREGVEGAEMDFFEPEGEVNG